MWPINFVFPSSLAEAEAVFKHAEFMKSIKEKLMQSSLEDRLENIEEMMSCFDERMTRLELHYLETKKQNVEKQMTALEILDALIEELEKPNYCHSLETLRELRRKANDLRK